jgi:hypothetical protein
MNGTKHVTEAAGLSKLKVKSKKEKVGSNPRFFQGGGETCKRLPFAFLLFPFYLYKR